MQMYYTLHKLQVFLELSRTKFKHLFLFIILIVLIISNTIRIY